MIFLYVLSSSASVSCFSRLFIFCLSFDLIVPTTHNSVSGPVNSTHPKVVWYIYRYVRLEMDMKYWLLRRAFASAESGCCVDDRKCVFLYKGASTRLCVIGVRFVIVGQCCLVGSNIIDSARPQTEREARRPSVLACNAILAQFLSRQHTRHITSTQKALHPGLRRADRTSPPPPPLHLAGDRRDYNNILLLSFQLIQADLIDQRSQGTIPPAGSIYKQRGKRSSWMLIIHRKRYLYLYIFI